MIKYSVNQIFTPATTAKINYIERKNLNKRINRALNTQGMQLVVYGHTGCGKTTLLDNKLSKKYTNRITTNCMIGMTFEQVLLNAFDSLDTYFTESKNNNSKLSKNIGFKALFFSIKESKVDETGQSQTRLLPPQLTAQNLGTLMGESGCCWVLEDFHKLENVEKKKLTQCMKVFMDLSSRFSNLKIIFIGATESAREVINLDKEMRVRATQIEVPLMDRNEIFTLIRNGFEFLDIGIHDVKIPDTLYEYCSGLPSICHKICSLICESLDVDSTVENINNKSLSEIEFDNDVIDILPSIKIEYSSNHVNEDVDEIESIINSENSSNTIISIQDTESVPKSSNIILKGFSENNHTEFLKLDSTCGVYVCNEDISYAKKEYIEDEKNTIICAFEKAFKIESASVVIEALSECSRHGDTIDVIWKNAKEIKRLINRDLIVDVLKKLATDEFGKMVVYSIDSDSFQFSDPFLRVFATLIYADGSLNIKRSSHNDRMEVFDRAITLLKEEP